MAPSILTVAWLAFVGSLVSLPSASAETLGDWLGAHECVPHDADPLLDHTTDVESQLLDRIPPPLPPGSLDCPDVGGESEASEYHCAVGTANCSTNPPEKEPGGPDGDPPPMHLPPQPTSDPSPPDQERPENATLGNPPSTPRPPSPPEPPIGPGIPSPPTTPPSHGVPDASDALHAAPPDLEIDHGPGIPNSEDPMDPFAEPAVILPRPNDAPLPPSAMALLFLAGWAYVLTVGRDLLVALGGRNVATPLGHPARVEIMRHVTATPGLSRSQLAARTSLSPLLARHHLRILRRAGLVDVVRVGNKDAYMLNHASFRFYLDRPGPDGGAAPGKRVFVAGALATLNHPTRRRICEVIKRVGPSDYAALVDAWNAKGEPLDPPTRRDVSYHGALMAEAGLLRRRPEGRRVRWDLNLDLEAVSRLARRQIEIFPGGRHSTPNRNGIDA